MRVISKKLGVFVFIGLLSLSFTSVVFAANETENSATGFFRRLFHWPGKAVEKTGEAVVVHPVENVATKVVAPVVENTGDVLTGNIAETGNLVAEPVVGTAETVGQAVAETVQAPVASVEATAETPAAAEQTQQ